MAYLNEKKGVYGRKAENTKRYSVNSVKELGEKIRKGKI